MSSVEAFWRPVPDEQPRGPWVPWGKPWINESNGRVTVRRTGILIPELNMDLEVPLDVPMVVTRYSSLRFTAPRWELYQ